MRINQNLLEAVLRIKDALIMFPKQESDRLKRVPSTMKTAVPDGRPLSLGEWFYHIRVTSKFGPEAGQKPRAALKVAQRKRLTEKDIETLRSLSYRKSSPVSLMMVA